MLWCSSSIKNNPGSSKSIESSAATALAVAAAVVVAETVERHRCSVHKDAWSLGFTACYHLLFKQGGKKIQILKIGVVWMELRRGESAATARPE